MYRLETSMVYIYNYEVIRTTVCDQYLELNNDLNSDMV